MTEEVFIAKGKNLNEAIKAAQIHFSMPAEKLDIHVVQNPRNLFGINLSPVVIEASPKVLPPENVDGSFSFSYSDDGVHLIMTFPKGAGKPILEDDIITSIVKKRIKDVDSEKIAQALVTRQEDMMIAPYQEQELIEETMEVTVDYNEMEAFVEFTPPEGGAVLQLEDILARLEEHEVVYGLNRDKLKSLTEQKVYDQRIKVANGSTPKDGVDGKVEYILDLTTSQKPKYLSDGTVDYYEIENYKTVSAGDVLARYIPPTSGTPGYNVRGKELKAYDGKEIKLPLGEQVSLADNGVDIVADVDGVAEIKSGKICVSNFLIINGDVDLSVGNVNFSGNIKITGNVMSCLSVTADGTIEIDGSVEAANVTAKGDVRIKRGVSGGKKGVIKAGGSVYAGFLENTTVMAEQNVHASTIIHCDVECGGSIVASGFKGIIYGGRLKALHKISAKVIGSTANVATILELGILPNLRNEYERLKAEAAKLHRELELISNITDRSMTNLSKRQEQITSKLVTDKIRKKFMLEGLKKEIANIESVIQTEMDATVNVLDTIYPGTKITIKTYTYLVNSQNSYTSYRLKEDSIESVPYSDK